MSGKETDVEKLNHTLERVVDILHTEKLSDWCIMYGTLLGIVREDGCIDGDNDIDIIINCKYEKIKTIFEKYNFKRQDENPFIFKTLPSEEYSSVDFYISKVNDDGVWDVTWNRNKISNCYVDLHKRTFIEKKWRSTILHLPNDYENKLVSMYGNWKKPKKYSPCPRPLDF